ncbi:hypothetical protein ACEWY4_005859 [Coilia grayii]|uniref:Ig-like domain-containing protein n=1 Tax=Coilia grayii TaxID=363190 RepID=A0ABD1KJS4_9TELE
MMGERCCDRGSASPRSGKHNHLHQVDQTNECQLSSEGDTSNPGWGLNKETASTPYCTWTGSAREDPTKPRTSRCRYQCRDTQSKDAVDSLRCPVSVCYPNPPIRLFCSSPVEVFSSGFSLCDMDKDVSKDPVSTVSIPLYKIVDNVTSVWVNADHSGVRVFREGQKVTLRCEACTEPPSSAWRWERQEENGSWKEVGTGQELVLSKMEESGVYLCHAMPFNVTSLEYEVYFFSTHHSVMGSLAVAALFMSLLVLLLFIALVLWLWLSGRVRERPDPNPGPTEPKNYGESACDSPVDEGDIYMNTVEIEKAYSDLNPSFMAGDQSYDTLA